MFRLLDASMELNTWAGALNMFTLWMVSAGMAGLIFALCARQPRRRLISGGGLAPVLLTSGTAEVRLAATPTLANSAARANGTAAGRAE